MGKRLSYILLLIGCMLFIACTDNILQETACGKVELKLTLNLPEEEVNSSSRVTGSNTDTPYLDETTKEQRYIQDVAILAMRNGKVDFIPENIKLDGDQGSNIRTITMTVPASDKPIDILVLLNAKENGIDVTEDNYIGKTEEEVHDKLVFTYPENTWDIDKRKLPMFGKAKDIDISSLHSFGYCNIYRSLAKMAVQVDEDCKTFNLTEVYLYYMEQKGYFMSAHTPETDVYTQYTQPDVPTSSVQTGTDNAKKFDVTSNAIFNKIYLPESNNKTPQNSKKELRVVVGGYYTGEGLVESGKLSYYRIDMSDERDQPFDIIRNHSYIFNITNVNNPGTPSPDKALDHAVPALKVEVEDWVTEYMRGVPDQYTLTVDKSVITLKDYVDYKNSNNPNHHYVVYNLDVWTDYSYGWEIQTNANGQIIGTDGEAIDWLDIENTSGNNNETVRVKLNANKINTGLTKTASFFVKAGNIRKEITVVMPQPETANCYVVGDGEFEIIVTIKGNGINGTRPEGKDIVDGTNSTGPAEDASLSPATLGIIWETKEGLITLWDFVNKKYVGGATRVPYNPQTGTLGFSVKSNYTGAYIAGAPGGNALVGAFDGNGKLIWSWHIWACPEMYDDETHQIKENVFLQNWIYTGYQVMDRNLGALSNKPIETQIGNKRGVAAMGLQYQWGRKDPFIGPAHSNDDFTGNGLLNVVHYYENWGVNGNGMDVVNIIDDEDFDKSSAIDYTIKHPTQLIYWNDENGPTALVSYEGYGGYLWGTNQGLNPSVKDLGTKTIYDPCPVGYRVPPVDAFMFSFEGYKGEVNGPYLDGNTWKHDNYVSRRNYKDINSDTGDETTAFNVRDNVIYIPHYVNYRQGTELYVLGSDGKNQIYIENAGGRYQWGDYHTWISCYEGAYVVDADYYGFYVNIDEMKEPKLMNIKKGASATKNTEQYDDAREYGNINKQVEYYYKPLSNQLISWLPMTGAYDPTKGFSFKDSKNKTISIEQGSTITVNSFLWTNSSVNRNTGLAPAALSLHGTEVHNANSVDNVNGRHFHNLSDTYANVDRHYTSAVRCIKDTRKVDWQTSNSLTMNIYINKGGSNEIRIKAVNGSWKLVDPGAPWLQITPEKGESTGAQEATITVKVSDNAVVGSTTNIGFKIEGETALRYCTVTVIDNKRNI